MMNWTTYFIECVASVILFTLAILVPLCKNPEWWIHDYPEDIQEEYFKTHPRIPSAFFSKTVLLKKSFALLLAVAIFVGLALLAGARDFLSAFLASYGLWLVVDWYDCLVLDWVLFANLKRVRLPGTEHMDDAYHQKRYHLVQTCIGMALGLIPCLLCAAIVALLAA